MFSNLEIRVQFFQHQLPHSGNNRIKQKTNCQSYLISIFGQIFHILAPIFLSRVNFTSVILNSTISYGLLCIQGLAESAEKELSVSSNGHLVCTLMKSFLFICDGNMLAKYITLTISEGHCLGKDYLFGYRGQRMTFYIEYSRMFFQQQLLQIYKLVLNSDNRRYYLFCVHINYRTYLYQSISRSRIMGGCQPNLVTQLVKLYGQKTIMDYALSQIGAKFLGQQFLGLKNQITSLFNSSPMFNNGKNINIFDKVIGQIFSNEQQQIGRMNRMKPFIKQLDDGPIEKKNQFFDIINKNYGKQINSFKDQLLRDVGDKLNVSKYLNGLNL